MHTFVLQDSANQRKFSIQTTDPANVGEHVLEIEISSKDWAESIEPVIYEVKIVVLPCKVTELVEPEDGPTEMSSLYLVFDLPYSQLIKLPKYEPSPACGLSNDNVDYTLALDNLPDWVIFNAEDRTVELAIDEDVSFNTVKVQIDATYDSHVKTVSFAVSRIGGAGEVEPMAPIDSGAVITPEAEPEPEPEAEQQSASTWDGWKSLLAQYKFLPEGVTLPPPNPDPNYIPTPPIPTIKKVDAKGKTQISFSEDVFMY